MQSESFLLICFIIKKHTSITENNISVIETLYLHININIENKIKDCVTKITLPWEYQSDIFILSDVNLDNISPLFSSLKQKNFQEKKVFLKNIEKEITIKNKILILLSSI